MVPLVGTVKELDYVKARIDAVARRSWKRPDIKIDYLVGTMIELPRAAIRAHVIAEAAEFFSFGTNDLTQTDLRHFARRCLFVPRDLSAEGNHRAGSLRVDRH